MTKKFISTFNFIAIAIFVAIFAFACQSKQNPVLSEQLVVEQEKADAQLYLSENVWVNDSKYGRNIFKIEEGKVSVARIVKVAYYDEEDELIANFVKNPEWGVVYTSKLSVSYSLPASGYKAEATLNVAADGDATVKYGHTSDIRLFKSEIKLTKDARLAGKAYISENIYANGNFAVDAFKIEEDKVLVARIPRISYYDTEDELIANFVKNPVWDDQYAIKSIVYTYALKSSSQKTEATLEVSPDGNAVVKYGNGLNTQMLKSELKLTKDARLSALEK